MRNNNINNLIGIQGVKTNILKQDDFSIHINIETDPNLHTCPSCSHQTSRVFDYRNQIIKHSLIGSKQIFLHLHKRRYICTHCHKKFYENYSFLTKYRRFTNSVFNKIFDDLMDTSNAKQIGKNNGMSNQNIIRISKLLIPTTYCHELPEVIGIDEFRGNANGKKFQVAITDIKLGKIIDILPDKSYDVLCSYFDTITNKSNVKFVVMDMCPLFKRAIKDKLHNATIIADKFHYTRLVTFSLERIRKKIQKNLPKHIRVFFKNSKKILNKRYDKLSCEEAACLESMLSYDNELRIAYEIKEMFFDINYETDITLKISMFKNWLEYASSSNITEFHSNTNSMLQWSKYIINSFKFNFTNALTEGMNNKIKVLKRICYGFRNFDNFRLRILLCCS